jgi:hypothetical protein
MPLEQIPGNVYVLRYDVPQRVKSVSRDYAGLKAVLAPGGFVSAKPTRHYVGLIGTASGNQPAPAGSGGRGGTGM